MVGRLSLLTLFCLEWSNKNNTIGRTATWPYSGRTQRDKSRVSPFFFLKGLRLGLDQKKIDFQYSNAEYELKVRVCALQRCKYVRGEMITFIFCMLILFQSFLKRFPLCSKLEKNVNGSMSLLVDNLCYIKYFNLTIIIIGVFRLWTWYVYFFSSLYRKVFIFISLKFTLSYAVIKFKRI